MPRRADASVAPAPPARRSTRSTAAPAAAKNTAAAAAPHVARTKAAPPRQATTARGRKPTPSPSPSTDAEEEKDGEEGDAAADAAQAALRATPDAFAGPTRAAVDALVAALPDAASLSSPDASKARLARAALEALYLLKKLSGG